MEVISVRFRSGCKEYFFDPRGTKVHRGDDVIVETANGTEYATCSEGNHEVDERLLVQPLRTMTRIATENDRRTLAYNRRQEKEAFVVCHKKIEEHGLDMKLVRVEINFDASKYLFYFTSDGRVDFRELVRDLAGVFRTRIELRQIGVRDEAKLLGGVGICGKTFCCAQFLDDFIPVSIKMAKTQNLSLNPTKISGSCGRLMCCLKYEQDAYEDAVHRCPKNDSFVLTPDGTGTVSAVDVLREQVTVRLDGMPETPKHYHVCELNVLRNGKGSRDGIEIPSERPARYQAEKPAAAQESISFFPQSKWNKQAEAPAMVSEDEEDAVPFEQKSEKRGFRGHRGGRNHHRGGAKPAAASAAPAEGQSSGEKKPYHRPHHRGGRNHRRGGNGGAPNAG